MDHAFSISNHLKLPRNNPFKSSKKFKRTRDLWFYLKRFRNPSKTLHPYYPFYNTFEVYPPYLIYSNQENIPKVLKKAKGTQVRPRHLSIDTQTKNFEIPFWYPPISSYKFNDSRDSKNKYDATRDLGNTFWCTQPDNFYTKNDSQHLNCRSDYSTKKDQTCNIDTQTSNLNLDIVIKYPQSYNYYNSNNTRDHFRNEHQFCVYTENKNPELPFCYPKQYYCNNKADYSKNNCESCINNTLQNTLDTKNKYPFHSENTRDHSKNDHQILKALNHDTNLYPFNSYYTRDHSNIKYQSLNNQILKSLNHDTNLYPFNSYYTRNHSNIKYQSLNNQRHHENMSKRVSCCDTSSDSADDGAMEIDSPKDSTCCSNPPAANNKSVEDVTSCCSAGKKERNAKRWNPDCSLSAKPKVDDTPSAHDGRECPRKQQSHSNSQPVSQKPSVCCPEKKIKEEPPPPIPPRSSQQCCESTCCPKNEQCSCHFPPAFSHFGCTGKISGSCNCTRQK